MDPKFDQNWFEAAANTPNSPTYIFNKLIFVDKKLLNALNIYKDKSIIKFYIALKYFKEILF